MVDMLLLFRDVYHSRDNSKDNKWNHEIKQRFQLILIQFEVNFGNEYINFVLQHTTARS